jgi:hypothetical protein
VPDAAAFVVVNALNVRTPFDTVPGVDDIGNDTSSVPVAAVAQLAGGEPV